MTMEQLSWFIDDTVAKRLLSIEGMAAVSRDGGVDREILRDARSGADAGAGRHRQRRSTARCARSTSTPRAARPRSAARASRCACSATPTTRYELSQTDIALGGGRTIKLADIAKVTDGYGEVTSIAKFDGRQVVTFGIDARRGRVGRHRL